MKKTFAMALAFIMIFATAFATVGAVSADEADVKDIMIATLNDVTLDGEISFTKGTGNKHKTDESGNNLPALEEQGKPFTAEYSLDTVLENSWIGAAYSIEKSELYFAVYSYDEVTEITVKVGGAEYKVDVAAKTISGGEGLAKVVISEYEPIFEISLPLSEIEIKEVARGLGADLGITVKTDEEDSFDGTLLFSKYATGFSYNVYNQPIAFMFSTNTKNNGNGSFTMTNDGAVAREYAGLMNIVTKTKNFVVKFDLNIASMPYSSPADSINDSPGAWQTTAAPRIWIGVKHLMYETLYVNIQNTEDKGIVLNVYENCNINFNLVTKQHTVVLGKTTGEDMVLELEWSEADSDGKCPLNVYVDGVLVDTVDNAMNINPALSSGSGVATINGQWTKDASDTTSEKIEYTLGNFSINEISHRRIGK